MITSGPDGNLWFSQSNWNGVGRATPEGEFDQVNFYNFLCDLDLVWAPDGAFWIACWQQIARVSLDGDIQRFGTANYQPARTGAVGPDARIWFTIPSQDLLVSIDAQGELQEIAVPTGAMPWSIVSRNDGGLWFSERLRGRISHVTPGGQLDQTITTGIAEPGHMTVDATGSLWVIDARSEAILQIRF